MTDAAIAPLLISQPSSGSTVTTERYPVRVVLVATAVVFLVLFLLLPLAAVFVEAFRPGVVDGPAVYRSSAYPFPYRRTHVGNAFQTVRIFHRRWP